MTKETYPEITTASNFDEVAKEAQKSHMKVKNETSKNRLKKLEAEIAQNTKKLQLLKEKNSNQELDLKQIQELEQKLQALEAEKKRLLLKHNLHCNEKKL